MTVNFSVNKVIFISSENVYFCAKWKYKRDWFRRFKNNDFKLKDKERSGASKKFEDKELEEILDEDRSHTLAELGNTLHVDESTVSKRSKVLGMMEKQDAF